MFGKQSTDLCQPNSDILAPALQHKGKEKAHNSKKNKRIMLPTALELAKKDAMRLGSSLQQQKKGNAASLTYSYGER